MGSAEAGYGDGGSGHCGMKVAKWWLQNSEQRHCSALQRCSIFGRVVG